MNLSFEEGNGTLVVRESLWPGCHENSIVCCSGNNTLVLRLLKKGERFPNFETIHTRRLLELRYRLIARTGSGGYARLDIMYSPLFLAATHLRPG